MHDILLMECPPKCAHEWEHIEDYHYYCAKCKTAADRCPKCGTSKISDRYDRLLCPKCNGL